MRRAACGQRRAQHRDHCGDGSAGSRWRRRKAALRADEIVRRARPSATIDPASIAAPMSTGYSTGVIDVGTLAVAELLGGVQREDVAVADPGVLVVVLSSCRRRGTGTSARIRRGRSGPWRGPARQQRPAHGAAGMAAERAPDELTGDVGAGGPAGSECSWRRHVRGDRHDRSLNHVRRRRPYGRRIQRGLPARLTVRVRLLRRLAAGLVPLPPPPPMRPPSKPPDEAGRRRQPAGAAPGWARLPGRRRLGGLCRRLASASGPWSSAPAEAAAGHGPSAGLPPKAGAGNGSTGWFASAAVMNACQVVPGRRGAGGFGRPC